MKELVLNIIGKPNYESFHFNPVAYENFIMYCVIEFDKLGGEKTGEALGCLSELLLKEGLL